MATEADVERQGDIGERCCELIDGVLLERTTGIPESMVAVTLARYLAAFVQKRRLGLVTGAEGTMRMAPGLILIPDVAFISFDRCPAGKVTRKPIPNLVPDLAVEVLSKNNTRQEMEHKLRYYFRVGVRLVWYVDVAKRTVRVRRGTGKSTRLAEPAVLDGGNVLPGFKLPLRKLFADLNS